MFRFYPLGINDKILSIQVLYLLRLAYLYFVKQGPHTYNFYIFLLQVSRVTIQKMVNGKVKKHDSVVEEKHQTMSSSVPPSRSALLTYYI